jgi:hypothetical protein
MTDKYLRLKDDCQIQEHALEEPTPDDGKKTPKK